ncbi:hypothetical protein MMC19_001548 [Ptychographa xylographoides]|nr:hypothetical protein [Ptychographa xylographoides]
MASIFSNRDSRKSDGALFARTARYAIEKNHGQFTLQLAQSRILIGLYYFAAGDATQAWDYGGAGVRVTTGLKMNLEQAIGQMEHDTPLDYGFNRQALEECYRRTFWCAFITDRFNGYATGLLCILQKEDIFLRLPCDDHRYEQQLQTEAPHFDNGIIDKRLVNPLAHATKGFMAYLITLATIWNDMLAEAYRLKHQASEDYAEAYERRYQKTYSRLESWQRELPPRYRLNVENTIVSVHDGNASMFSSMHCLYHTTGMILNRRVRHTCLPAASIDRNVRKALHHAQQLLSMIQTFHEMPHPEHSSTSHPHQELSGPVLISTPFNGYGIMNVIDITSATGSLDAASFRDTLECWNSALAVLKQVARFWDSAKRQKRTVKKRVQAIVSCVLARGQGKLAWIAGTPLETPFNALDLDLFYSHPSSSLLKTGPNRILAAALGMKADESQILFLEDEDLRRSSLDGGGMGAMHDLRFTVPT